MIAIVEYYREVPIISESRLSPKCQSRAQVTFEKGGELCGEEKLNSTVSNFELELLTFNKNHRKEVNELSHKHSSKVKTLHQEQKVTLEEKDTELKDLKEKHDSELDTEKTSKRTLERRYKVALLQVKTDHRRQEYVREKLDKKDLKKHKWMATHVYLLSIFSLTQILWMLIS